MSAHDQKDLTSSLEDYLEAIFHLEQQQRVARAKDIADRVGVARASVTTALKTLADRGLINYEPYSYITLTTLGKKKAQEVVRRHTVLKEFFQDFLRLESSHADDNACRVEHALDEKATNRLVEFLSFLRECPRGGEEWLKSFEQFCADGPDEERCKQCISDCENKV